MKIIFRQKDNVILQVHTILNSYAQVFFSDNKLFGFILLLITFVDKYAGIYGLVSVLTTIGIAHFLGFSPNKISKGYYGFNSLLAGLGLGIYFQPGLILLLVVIMAGIFTLFISVALEGILGKYGLPYLSMPFVLSLWAFMLASRDFQALGLSERGIYTLNEIYRLGGFRAVRFYSWWAELGLPPAVRSYFLSLGAILFQQNVFAGLLMAIGLLIYSRIAFSLSLLGFFTAFLFYKLIGASFTEVGYSYIGFNYILSAIALGGYFIIPNRSSYFWVMLLIPLVAVVTISLSGLFGVFQLPLYSLPFNIISLLFLYVIKFRVHNRAALHTGFIQQNTPEKNLYAYSNYLLRFGKDSPVPISLPFLGDWTITQGHNGTYTHKGAWKYAWDFEIAGSDGKTYKGEGNVVEDYYCYGKAVLAPADGIIESVADHVEDNPIGLRNLEYNWGNTVIIKHQDQIYSKLSHLMHGSIQVSPGTRVSKGDVLGKCGSSGNSPYPHLHFQIQATPYIGSRTMEYPISNYFLKSSQETRLMNQAIPQQGEVIGNIKIHPSLKSAFYFIPGERFSIDYEVSKSGIITRKGTAVWEVKRDDWNNAYIECDDSRCRAWFRIDNAILYFTHFEGLRNSLLYYFYLGAFKVCLGARKHMELSDQFPVNMIFSPGQLFIHDLLAPFYQYKSADYILQFINLRDSLEGLTTDMNATIRKSSMGFKNNHSRIVFQIRSQGLESFRVETKEQTITAKWSKRAD